MAVGMKKLELRARKPMRRLALAGVASRGRPLEDSLRLQTSVA